MAKFLTPLINEDIDAWYSRIYEPFIFESDVLKKAGYDPRVEVPIGFVHDYESVPIIKGTSKHGGVGHDYLSRIDSVPCVTKKIAADVYFEIMKSRVAEKIPHKKYFTRFNLWWRRWLKWGTVIIAPGYFHKHKVMATYEEMIA